MRLAKLAYVLSLLNLLVVIIIVITLRNPHTNPVNSDALPTAVKLAKPTMVIVKPNLTNSIAHPLPTTPQVAAASTPDTRCIVLIDGIKYNVTDFRNIHSGGDIFQCNTDMSSIFHQKHDASYLQRMNQYKI